MISIGKKSQRQSFDALVAKLNLMLKPFKFEKSGEWEWRRKSDWKIEEIDLVLRGDISWHILPTFRVLLPRIKPSQFGDKYHHIAQANIDRFLNPKKGHSFEVMLPSVGIFKDKFVNFNTNKIINSLSWFDQFSTPEKSKSNIKLFLKPGCPAYQDAEFFLNSLIS